MVEVPTIERTGNIFRFQWPSLGVAAILRRLRAESPYVKGEVTWVSVSPGQKGHLHQGLLSLNSSSSKAQLAKLLTERHPEKDWLAVVEQLAVRTLEMFRQGEPAVPLRPADSLTDSIPLTVSPLFHEGQPFVLYGEPGTLKSYLGLTLAVLAATGRGVTELPFRPLRDLRPLYLDWESTQRDQANRLARLERGLNLDSDGRIHYRYQSGPLARDVEAVQEIVLDLGADFLIVDSLGPAAGGDLNSPESAQDFFAAIRSLKCTALILAHTAKNADPSRRTIFGSQFFNALARGTAELKRFQEPGEDVASLGIFHRKSNLGRLERPFGLAFTFNGDCVLVRSQDVRTIPELAEGLSAHERILEVLRSGPVKPKDLSDLLAMPDGTVRSALRRLRERGHVHLREDGRYGLEDGDVPF